MDVAVHHAEGDGRRGAELVFHDLLGVEVVDALILAGVAAEGKALADQLEGVLDAFAQLAGEDAGLGGGVIDEFAGLGADLNDLALFHDDHALAVGHGDQGAVGDDVVVALGVGGTAGDALLALDDQHVLVDRVAVEKLLPLISQHAADCADARRNKTHSSCSFLFFRFSPDSNGTHAPTFLTVLYNTFSD